MTAYPFGSRVSLEEFKAIKRLAADRKAKRSAKAAVLWQKGSPGAPPRARKPSKASSLRRLLISRLDKLYSLAVRRRDSIKTGGMCVFGCGSPIQCAFHFVTRSKYIVRWDLQNGVGSCFAQNYEMEFNPHPYIAWYRKEHGEQAYDDLVTRSNKIAKFSNSDLLEIKARLESFHANLGTLR